MIFLQALWAKVWPYVAVAGAVLTGLFAVRQSGKSAARTEAAAKINEQAAQARKEQRDVENEIASLDDDSIDRRLDEWVRRQ